MRRFFHTAIPSNLAVNLPVVATPVGCDGCAAQRRRRRVARMIEAFWAEFVAATGIDGPYEAWAFGDPSLPDLSTKLALTVRDGPKRATAGLASDYDDGKEPMPKPGDLNLILDGEGVPVCVIRTTAVSLRRFGDVDEAFAWDEGEGDRTLAW